MKIDNYVILDFETTGLSIFRDNIIEVGLLKIVDGQIIDEFTTLIDPERNIPSASSEINGIYAEDVICKPLISDVLPQICNFIDNSIIVGHNIKFDLNFLTRELKTYSSTQEFYYLDTVEIAKMVDPTLPTYKLDQLIKHFKIAKTQKHRALDDALLTYKLFEKCCSLCLDKKENLSPHRYIEKDFYYKPNFNKTTITLQELKTLSEKIIADGKVTEYEVLFLYEWIHAHENLKGNYPFDKICSLCEEALLDGILTDEEKATLFDALKKIALPVEDCCCCKIDFTGKQFVLTGNFDHGSKKDIEKQIITKGGFCKESLTLKADYLIVGGAGNDNWKFGNYGGKVSKALEMQEKGHRIIILREIDLINCL